MGNKGKDFAGEPGWLAGGRGRRDTTMRKLIAIALTVGLLAAPMAASAGGGGGAPRPRGPGGGGGVGGAGGRGHPWHRPLARLRAGLRARAARLLRTAPGAGLGAGSLCDAI